MTGTPAGTGGATSTGAAAGGPRTHGSLTRRLVAAQVAVVAAMTATVVAAAALVGPAVFDRHMREAGHDSPMVLAHAQEAFRSAGLAAMTAGLVIAALGAVASALLTARVIGRGLDALAAGAGRVAAGRYDEPVVLPAPAGRELAAVAGAFNAMAARVEQTEATRRRMLTDLAHELRTPVAAIDVTLEAVEDGVLPLDDAATATLRDQTARLARLARDVRDVSAAEEGRIVLERGPVDLVALAARSVQVATPVAAAQGVTLRLVADHPVPVDADPARLGQVLDNLVRNALQHTASGSVTVSVHADGPDAVATVVDTGSGIGPEHLPHVFERFYRADPGRRRDPGSGTGVGLAIARAIAIAHGGTLTAASDGPGRGARFELRLPRA